MNLAMSSPAPWSGAPSQENQPFKKLPPLPEIVIAIARATAP